MKKTISILLSLIMILSTLPLTAVQSCASDEIPDGYKAIYTIEDLYCIRYDMTSNYILMNDIDMSEATAEGGDWDYDGRGWDPIGSNGKYSATEFSGIFDGNGHTISGMRIRITTIPSGAGDLCIGLFASLTGTIKNLNLLDIDVYVNIKSYYKKIVGSFCAYSSGNIINCKNSGHMEFQERELATSYIGGIVGYESGGSILNCSNNSTILFHHTRTGISDPGSYVAFQTMLK